MTQDSSEICGVVPIDKASDMTSHDVVGMVRRVFRPAKIKVGHAGTLDPDATGLLLVCIGSATRLADLLADRGKVYHAGFVLGVATSTEDASGEVSAEQDASRVTESDVLQALTGLTGDIQQVPPMVSALHHEGRRLYDLARQGIEVERAARPVTVESIDLVKFAPGRRAQGDFIVSCGKGVYVRTLCADLGKILGVGGHMSTLRRLSIGDFNISNVLPTSEITRDSILEHLVPAAEAVSFLPIHMITEQEKVDILHGRAILSGKSTVVSYEAEWIRLVDRSGELIALATFNEDAECLWPKKVLGSHPGEAV
jgi:tRNA pseudouridine55 synthase